MRVFEPGAGFGALMTGLVLGSVCQSGLAPVVPSGLASPVTSTVVSALPGVARYTIRRPSGAQAGSRPLALGNATSPSTPSASTEYTRGISAS